MSNGHRSEDLPPPPWSSVGKKKRPREPLSREVLTTAALKIVDDEGLEALSMRRLAEDLDAVASAIYAHVEDKPELMQLMIDRVVGQVPVPPQPDPKRWESQLKDTCRALYREMVKHRDLCSATLGNVPTGHNVLRFVDGLLAIVRAGKLPRQACAYAADLLPEFVAASAFERALFTARLEGDPKYFQKLHAYFRSLPKGAFPVAGDLVDEMIAQDEAEDARFEFGLDVIVRGLSTFSKR